MDLEVTWIHHWKKKGKRSTLTRPLRVNAVHGLLGLALPNVDPEKEERQSIALHAPYASNKQIVQMSIHIHLVINGYSPLTKSTSMRSGLT
jgi:hypothetical protein